MNEKVINPDCPCKSLKCPNHGDCAACRENHKNSLTACQRAKKD